MGLELTPEVLTQKSREIITRLGYEGRPTDSAFDLDYNGDFQDYVEKNDKPPHWDAVLGARPSLLQYWYRQSPDSLVASNFRDQQLTPGIVTRADPPTVLSGMINLELDPQGRLTYFQAIPPQKQPEEKDDPKKEIAASSAPAVPFDWDVLFAGAGLDASTLQPAQPAWTSLAASDTRMAWTGTWPGTTRPLRVEAAAFQGKPVFFSLIGDWTKPERMKSTEKKTFGEKVSKIFGLVLLCTLLLGSGFLARRNYRRGRGDREGALRLALVMFALEMGLFLCRTHFGAIGDAIGLSILAVSTGMFISGVTWMLYMAIEPWVRRHWPQTIISWSRLLSGKGRDPLVGRDILFGVASGGGVDSRFSDSLHPHDADGGFARALLDRCPDGRTRGVRGMVATMAAVDSKHAGLLLCAVWTEGSAAQGVDCCHCFHRDLCTAACAEQYLYGG